MSESESQHSLLLRLAAGVVSAHVGKNTIQAEALPGLIQQVYQSLASAGAEAPPPADRPQPAVPVKKSVHPDYIICLEDGAKLKMLKRYLQTRFQMSPDEYRTKWGLPSDYPMVAPNYAERRSSLAKSIGLGRKQGGGQEGGRQKDRQQDERQDEQQGRQAAAMPKVVKEPGRRGRKPNVGVA